MQSVYTLGDAHYCDLSFLSGVLYGELLSVVPALCRSWFGSCPPHQKALIETLTLESVSPPLIQRELDFASSKQAELNARVSRRARNIHISYEFVDGTTMELSVQIPSNYPLSNVFCCLASVILLSDRPKGSCQL
jgi:hypothetical protein